MTTDTKNNAPLLNIDDVETYLAKPRFKTDENGVYWINIQHDKDGNATEKPPAPLCSTLSIVGSGIDQQGQAYRMIEYKNTITGQKQIHALANAKIGSNWNELQGLGITIYAGRQNREKLADYLQTQGSRQQWHVTGKAGWIQGAYILPSGEIISPNRQTDEMPRIYYNGDKSQAHGYTVSGSLKEWQDNIARYAVGNSRLCLALGIAFAAPLLEKLDIEGGGIHLQGNSSTGKTTAVNISLSVYGNPKTLKTTWSGTSLGFNNIAAARNDGFMVLDEIHQATPHDVSRTVYNLFNGVNKIQGAKEGGNRALTQWRIMVLSTGEVSPETMLKNKAAWKAGQNVRLPTVYIDTGKHAIYETLHGFNSGAELSEYLNRATARHHGIAAHEYIKSLDKARLDAAQATQRAFMQSYTSLAGQPHRICQRFALIAAALESANHISVFASGIGFAAIKQIFDEWLQQNGASNHEDKQIISQTQDFFDIHGLTSRFAPYGAKHAYDHSHHHAGYYELNGETRILYVVPAVFKEEIAKDFEPSKAADVLIEIDWLQKNIGKDGKIRHQFQKSNGQRFYKFMGLTPPYRQN